VVFFLGPIPNTADRNYTMFSLFHFLFLFFSRRRRRRRRRRSLFLFSLVSSSQQHVCDHHFFWSENGPFLLLLEQNIVVQTDFALFGRPTNGASFFSSFFFSSFFFLLRSSRCRSSCHATTLLARASKGAPAPVQSVHPYRSGGCRRNEDE
jgi:hypothetical protein